METQEHENKPAIGPKSLKKGQAPKAKNNGELQVYAYTLKDPAFGEFFILNSANAWWLDNGKVQKLIDAFKLECTVKEACFYAGVSRHQWEYFIEKHPDFSVVIDACRQALGVYARQHFAKRVKEGDDGAVMTYLRKKHKQEFAGQLNLADPDGNPIQNQNAIVFVDFSEEVTTEPYEEPRAEEPKQLPEHAESQ